MHVCTYLNAFLMVIPDIVTKFHNVDIFCNFCEICYLSSAHACHVESVNHLNYKVYNQKCSIRQQCVNICFQIWQSTNHFKKAEIRRFTTSVNISVSNSKALINNRPTWGGKRAKALSVVNRMLTFSYWIFCVKFHRRVHWFLSDTENWCL